MKPTDHLLAASRASRWLVPIVLAGVFVAHALGMWRWLDRNTLPNGYQNEIFHLGNALELWVAWQERSWTVLHNLLFEQYWPPLQYLTAFPFLAAGVSRDAFVGANLLYLALLLVSVYLLGARLDTWGTGLLAAVLLCFFPSIFGNLRHFEPNVPLTAMVACSMVLLDSSRRFSRTGRSLLFGVCAGLTMLVDRLSGAFFLAFPAAWVLVAGLASRPHHLSGRPRIVWRNAGLAVLLALLVCGYYYVNFFQYHREEVFSQVMAGEIQDTGAHSEIRDPLALTTLAFYPLTLLDGQVGFGLGLVLCLGVVLAAFRSDRRRSLLWVWLIAPLVVFTFIQKKQIYYTIPILPALALLGASGLMSLRQGWRRSLAIGVALCLGAVQYQVLSFGTSPVAERFVIPVGGTPRLVDLGVLFGRSPIPPPWVAPKYVQAQPPIDEDFRIPGILDALGNVRRATPVFRVGTFSEDSLFFEGYLTFFVRCAFPHAIVNGLIQNPEGFYENLRLMDAFVYVTASRRTFPTTESIRRVMAERHALDALEALPILSVLEVQAHKWERVATLALSTGARVHVHGLRPWQEPRPPP